MYQKLTTVITLILLSSSAYCQIKPHPEGFIISREYAELIANRFDSLKVYKQLLPDAISALDTCTGLLSEADELKVLQERNIAGLKEEISALNNVLDSYKRIDFINSEAQRQLRKEKRKRKLWQIIGIGSGAGLITSIIILAI